MFVEFVFKNMSFCSKWNKIVWANEIEKMSCMINKN